MERDEDHKCMEVPNSFFENLVKLQVLYISGHENRPLSLPYSIRSIANIRSILVNRVDLGNISILGNLQSLETLDLVECKINELPQEITMFGKFKLLKLEECEIRRNDPFEVIGRCSTLEELYFMVSFNDFCREITLPKLQRYHIRKGWVWSRIYYSLSKYVALIGDDCCFSKETYKYFMQTSKGLQLNGINEGWKNLMPEIVDIHLGMNELVELRMSNISQLQCLIDTNGYQVSSVLSELVVLELQGMENLEVLFNGSLSFNSLNKLEEVSINHCEVLQRFSNCKLNLCYLKTVTLWECPMLVDLSSLLTSRNLVLLEKLQIIDCEKLTNIIVDERREGESKDKIIGGDNANMSHDSMFPKLKVLVIEGCHRLKSILPLHSSQMQHLLLDFYMLSLF